MVEVIISRHCEGQTLVSADHEVQQTLWANKLGVGCYALTAISKMRRPERGASETWRCWLRMEDVRVIVSRGLDCLSLIGC